ncbi:serine/threonine-protein kinase AFC2-like isoform X2 [Amaranthus tricolor]|uniref:serine/threonine-protein kinase AFC2-like isoform X2 n=1 Tax=Amaranthus tricolor TaxID=29722 RepID=UPI0025855790|nr:serine/threonine-protein kinase AFC2-like isoform X2 [Amaranthus tricolor]
MIEIDVLEQLSRHYSCVQMRNWFDYRNHICIVFEMLGPSLFEFLRKNNYQSFPVDLVREIGRQLLEFLAFMHDFRLVHTDLKPENIVFISSEYVKKLDYKGTLIERKMLPKSCAIKVIDFGSTVQGSHPHHYIVTTRYYRAPEVILGLGWSYPCDLWSVGCILAELCSGEILFQTCENLEHLAMMERVLGPFPENLLRKADRHAEKYIRQGRLNWPEDDTSWETIDAVLKLTRIQILLTSCRSSFIMTLP